MADKSQIDRRNLDARFDFNKFDADEMINMAATLFRPGF